MKGIEIDWKWTSIALGAVIAVGYITSQMSKSEPTVIASPVATPTEASKSGLSETDAREYFVDGCVEGGQVTTSYCSCAWDYLRERFSVDQLVDMGREYDPETDKPTQVMFDAAYACYEYL